MSLDWTAPGVSAGFGIGTPAGTVIAVLLRAATGWLGDVPWPGTLAETPLLAAGADDGALVDKG